MRSPSLGQSSLQKQYAAPPVNIPYCSTQTLSNKTMTSNTANPTAKKLAKHYPQPSSGQQLKQLYSIYVSSSTVELYDIGAEVNGDLRLVCSQTNYLKAFEFAVNLAKNKRLIFQNFVPHGSRY